MNREQIMEAIKTLARSQGSYGSLYVNLCNLRDNSPEEFDTAMTELENQQFKDAVDLVLYLET